MFVRRVTRVLVAPTILLALLSACTHLHKYPPRASSALHYSNANENTPLTTNSPSQEHEEPTMPVNKLVNNYDVQVDCRIIKGKSYFSAIGQYTVKSLGEVPSQQCVFLNGDKTLGDITISGGSEYVQFVHSDNPVNVEPGNIEVIHNVQPTQPVQPDSPARDIKAAKFKATAECSYSTYFNNMSIFTRFATCDQAKKVLIITLT